MTANTRTFAAAPSAVSTRKGSIFLLAAVFAFVRAALVIVAAVSFGTAARYLFWEMSVLPKNPVVLLAAVAIDTFAVSTLVLRVRAKTDAARAH